MTDRLPNLPAAFEAYALHAFAEAIDRRMGTLLDDAETLSPGELRRWKSARRTARGLRTQLLGLLPSFDDGQQPASRRKGRVEGSPGHS